MTHPTSDTQVRHRSKQVGSLLVKLLDMYGYESRSACSYLDALTIPHLEDSSIFALSEISLSFSPGHPPTVRCLGELVDEYKSPFPEGTVSRIGDHIILTLEKHGGKYDRELFHDLTEIAYTKYRDTSRALRFGAALEFSENPFPGLKCYFDLHSDGPEFAAERLTASFHRLEFEQFLPRARELLGCRLKEGRCRGIGIDLGTSNMRALRLYTPGSRWSFDELRELLSAIGCHNSWDLLDLYNTSVLGGLTSRESSRDLLVSLVFSSMTGHEPVLKLDAFMPALKPDDLASFQAFCSLADNMKIPSEEYVKAFRVLCDLDSLSNYQRIHQYLSVDFLSAPRAKLNAYFRLPGIETEHMQPHVLPQRKQHMLRRIDEACRAAIQVIESERLTGYNEATHRMLFPHVAGFSSAHELHVGVVFQTALIIDALLDARRRGFLIDSNGLNDDVKRLVSMRSYNGVHSWKYFPSLPELPPDADDLAQVMQALIRVDYNQLNELVDSIL